MPNQAAAEHTGSQGALVATSGIAPLLKWPGGKRKLSAVILSHFPSMYGRYIEPLCGGAAIFFALAPGRSRLCDANSDLIECYKVVAKQPEDVIYVLGQLRNTRDDYY